MHSKWRNFWCVFVLNTDHGPIADYRKINWIRVPSFHPNLTPCSTVILEKMTVPQLAEWFSPFYKTRKLISVFKADRHLSLSWTTSIQSMSSQLISSNPILILSPYLGLYVFTVHNQRLILFKIDCEKKCVWNKYCNEFFSEQLLWQVLMYVFKKSDVCLSVNINRVWIDGFWLNLVLKTFIIHRPNWFSLKLY
jgi:hypothetical protein